MVRLAFAILLLACSTAVHAAPSAQELKQAKQHYAQGKAAQDLGKYEDAIAEYEAAYKLAPRPKLLFNIGQCQRLKGDKQKALQAYEAYVAAAPDDEFADDARDQIAALKLRIEVEQSELRSRRAEEEAAAARKQALEAEAARQKWEREQAERTRAIFEEQARQRRAAEEAAVERARRERADAEVRKQQNVAAAKRAGFAMRIAGPCILAAGLAIYGGGYAYLVDGQAASNALDQHMWTTADDLRVERMRTDNAGAWGMWITGSVLIVGGVTVAIVGGVKRSRAIDRAQAGR